MRLVQLSQLSYTLGFPTLDVGPWTLDARSPSPAGQTTVIHFDPVLSAAIHHHRILHSSFCILLLPQRRRARPEFPSSPTLDLRLITLITHVKEQLRCRCLQINQPHRTPLLACKSGGPRTAPCRVEATRRPIRVPHSKFRTRPHTLTQFQLCQIQSNIRRISDFVPTGQSIDAVPFCVFNPDPQPKHSGNETITALSEYLKYVVQRGSDS